MVKEMQQIRRMQYTRSGEQTMQLLLSENKELRREITFLKSRQDLLENELTKIKNTEAQVIVVKQISDAQARKLILDYFKKNKTARISEVQEKLGIDYLQILKITDKLKKKKLLADMDE
ncbi:MAG: hypothetical protein HYW50_00525 [Candidatus Diapherotrites archaeon]|nr:hypothetical protein [Candidatus Diapherotrites archaeon]